MNKIMFKDQYNLTRAVLIGNKIMTRRNEMDCNLRFYLNEYEDSRIVIEDNKICIYSDDGYLLATRSTRYKIGEIIAIAQSYEDIACGAMFENWDLIEMQHSAGWTNKMFVKAEYMPNRIMITGIKAERLQDISEADILKEGIYKFNEGVFAFDDKKGYMHSFNSAQEAFVSLINKVSGKNTWNSNPFVIVYEFELVK